MAAPSPSLHSGTAALRVDLAAAGLLPPLPRAWLEGRDLDLLAPLRLALPGAPPPLPPLPGAPVLAARRALADALSLANRGYGHPDADRLAARLADPATRVVVGGQQPGLFGGPLYTLVKAVALGRWAAALEAQGEPAVAVFWVATEDHDWRELAAAAFPTPEGVRAFDLGPDPEPLVPIGMRTFGPEVEAVLEALRAAIPGERYAAWLATLARWYRPDARFGEAFCRLLAHLLGARCPLLLDAMLPPLKEAQRPVLERLVERRDAVEAAFVRADAAISGRGHPLQVAARPGEAPLFLIGREGRRRVEWRDGGFVLRGVPGAEPLPIAELLETIAQNPGAVSPGVRARSVVQDAVLGTALQVLGPAELSYMAQAAGLYEVLELEAPAVALRPQAVVLEPRQAARLEEEGLALADLLGPVERLERRLAEDAGGDVTAAARRRIEETLDGLRAPVVALDPSLERPWEKAREQVLKGLDLLGSRVVAAAARRDEVRRRRIEQLREAVLPLGKLQERVVSTAHFPGKHGDAFAAALWEQLELEPRELQAVVPDGDGGA
ncbi:MAG TPA: bacillithiol biosynthesis cysteine-adding enzyme BshC [Thermoanaerobaculia bacterium]|nr:bacillithiol biosynthesis cysteine-adding enzyme BshC [Thermoanaerobaculia bacterium]